MQSRILVCGGSDGNGSVLNSCEAFDGESWKLIGSMRKQRRFAAAATLGERVYVFGGSLDDLVHDDVELYDSSTNNWTLLSLPLNTKRCKFPAASLTGRIYLIGGCADSDQVPTDQVDRFDSLSSHCLQVTNLSAACSGLAVANTDVSDETLLLLRHRQNCNAQALF